MKRYKPEEIVALLREADSSGEVVADFCRRKGIADATLYRWRRKYGDLQVDAVGEPNASRHWKRRTPS